MPSPFSFIPTLAPNAHADSRAYYDYAPINMAPNVNGLNGQPGSVNPHRHQDPATAYALPPFNRDQMIQRSTLQPFVGVNSML